MKKLFYSVQNSDIKVECFKLDDVDETIEPGYEIMSTANNGETTSVFGYTPQSAIALADTVMTL